ncbi:MAG: branched-chain amino acid ABC transporter permease [Rhodospirillaceae bacterium]|nr:branched-chain amino acid ABC transporter permease [Rhodospirillaceae bacterium]
MDSFFLQLLINGIIVGTLYGVVAMAFVLIYKASQVVNFAQGEFLLIGAWVCWWIIVDQQVPFWAAFPMTLAFMMAFGVALQVIVLRPMIGEPVISVIMVTIGLSIFFQALLKWMFGVSPQRYPQIFETDSINILGLQVQSIYIFGMIASLLIMIIFALFFKYSKMGLAMRATAFDQQAAQSLGVSIKAVFATSWAISAMVSALAGIVVGVVNGVSSDLSAFGIKVFPAVILGGLDSVLGAVLGGLMIGVMERLAQYFDADWGWGNMIEIVPFYALILILMIKPYGLFGTRDIERV